MGTHHLANERRNERDCESDNEHASDPGMSSHANHPGLRGGFAPVAHELTLALSDVEGEIPRDLNGMHVRNGSNRRYAAPGRFHWFDGDGMLHALRFEAGRVQYQNRWIGTLGLRQEEAAGGALWQGIKDPPRQHPKAEPGSAAHATRVSPYKNTANTDVVFYAGQLACSWYLGGAVSLCDPHDLRTTGVLQSDPRLAGLPISAHGKVDEQTGEYLFFSYGKEPPYMHYGVLDRHGTLQTFMPVNLPGPRLPHDMGITAHHTILHDLPVFYDLDALAAGRHKLKFHADLPSRFGVVPRHGRPEQIRWFDASPGYVYHVSNAWEESDGQGGTDIVMTGTPFRNKLHADSGATHYEKNSTTGRYNLLYKPDGTAPTPNLPRLLAELDNDCVFYEWRFNLRTGKTRERVIDDLLNQEFPIINTALRGHKTRYAWNLLMARNHEPEAPRFCGLVRHDLQTGRCSSYHEGPQTWFNDMSFAPRDNCRFEDDGYLVGFVWEGAAQQSWVYVMDAANIAQGPVARIRVPERVPHGFHGTWVSAQRLARGY